MRLPLIPGVAHEIVIAMTREGTQVYARELPRPRLPPPEPIEEGENVDDEISNYFDEED